MDIKTLTIDISKSQFHTLGFDQQQKQVFKRVFTRKKLIEFLGKISPCEVVMEACGTSHFWARATRQQGHEPYLINPRTVKKYVNPEAKNDFNDALGIFDAFTRPHMKFVAIKSQEQQSMTALHRARSRVISNRTQLLNQIRAILSEEGYPYPRSTRPTKILEEVWDELEGDFKLVFQDLLEEQRFLDDRIKGYNRMIESFIKGNPTAQRLMEIPGVGPITASALLCEVGDFRIFTSGRQFAAWLGVVPRQNTTGGKVVLGGITKAGNGYLRRLMVQGAHTLLRYVEKKREEHKTIEWMHHLITVNKCHRNKACVGMVNKMCRIIWAMMIRGTRYDGQHVSLPPAQYQKQDQKA